MGDEAAAGERRLAKLWRMNKQLIDDSAPLYGCVGFDLMSCLAPRPVLGERKQDWEDKVYNFKALMKLNPSASQLMGLVLHAAILAMLAQLNQ